MKIYNKTFFKRLKLKDKNNKYKLKIYLEIFTIRN